MATKKLVTLLSIYFLSSTAITQAMENEKLDIFYSNNTNGSMQIQSIVNKHKKYTEFIIDNVNGGITHFHGKGSEINKSGTKGISLKGVNNLEKFLAFIQIQSNGQAQLMEPHLEIEVTDEHSEESIIFNVGHNALLTRPIVNLNGNEIWDNIQLDIYKTSVDTTGFQQLKIRLKHES